IPRPPPQGARRPPRGEKSDYLLAPRTVRWVESNSSIPGGGSVVRSTRVDSRVATGGAMSSLHILKTPGPNQGATIPLDGDKVIIGRNPDCGIVIPVTSVSREHAQILKVQGKFHIEDLQSRNGTFVNNQAISARVPLKNNDRIRICDFLAVFVEA